jgi:hypothetical protein
MTPPARSRLAVAYPPQIPAWERALRRTLRIPQAPPKADSGQAERLFTLSIAVSAARCLLSYVVLPVLVPLLGRAAGVGPALGIPLGVLALVFDIRAVRRFWLAEHRWRRPITGVYIVVMAMVSALLIHDIVRLA